MSAGFNREVLHDRGALLWLLGATAAVVVPLLPELPWWVGVLYAFAAAWRLGALARPALLPGRVVHYFLAALAVALTWREFQTLLGRDAGLTLLTVLLGFKFLEIKTRRDYLVSTFLCYLVLLGSFLFEQSIARGALALAGLWLSTTALIRITQPCALDDAARLKLAGLLLAKALPLMLVLYVLFPRLQGGLWSLPDPGSAVTGMGETMRPGSIHRVSQSHDTVFRASFEGAVPGADVRYFRVRVLWRTDGEEWVSGDPATTRDVLRPRGTPVRYELLLEPSTQRFVPALDLPAQTAPGTRARSGFVLETIEPPRERTVLALTSYADYHTAELAPAERDAALTLPPQTSERVRALAQQWRAGAARDADVVAAALAHLRTENFSYTLTPPLLGRDPVDEFLFASRRGFCEHYAAAFAVLMRAAGIPARVVMGYQGGELGATGNYLIVRQSDAHAWTEVWLPGQGWRRVDPTSAIAPERVELGSEALRRLAEQGTPLGTLAGAELAAKIALPWFEQVLRHTRLSWDLANLVWYRWVAAYGPEQQQQLLRQLGWDGVSAARLLGAALLGALALFALYFAWLHRRPRPRDPVLRVYEKFCRKLARAGLVRSPHEGPAAFAARCAAARPALRAALAEVTDRYVALRYGRAPMTGLRGFRRAVATLRLGGQRR